jgi:flavin reductase (DIM6/NTAB) family NADH-FMN oxidoreductase RutF
MFIIVLGECIFTGLGCPLVSQKRILNIKNYHFARWVWRSTLNLKRRKPYPRSTLTMLDRPMMDPRELRNAFGCLPTGVTVVSLNDEAGKPTGVTVGSFTSLSMSPALCLFSLGKNQASARLFKENVPFVVNVLSPELADLAWQFAKPLDDKFEGVAITDTLVAAPRLSDCIAHFACHTHAIHDGGDHIIVVGEIMGFDHEDGDALIFYRGAMHKPAAL